MRFRGVWLLLAMVLLSSCTHDTERPLSGADRTRSAELAGLRTVDPCALYGATPTLAGNAVTVTGPYSVITCNAQIGDAAADIDASLGLNITVAGVQADESWLEHLSVDGVDVTVGRPEKAPNALPRDQVKKWSCPYAARYPDGVRLMVEVSSPPSADNCGMGLELVTGAIRQYAKRPPWGSSAFAPTVVSGKDPCASAGRLAATHRIEWDLENSQVTSCAFAVDGAKVTLDLDYADPTLFDYNPDKFEVNGRRVIGDKSHGVFDVVVGPQFQAAGRTQVPVATIVDPSLDMDQIRLLAGAVTEEFKG